MKATKALVTIGIASAMMQFSACKDAGSQQENVLLTESALPFGAPEFDQIQVSDYLPAIKAGIEAQRANIAAIVNNEEPPTFENTIVALDESGRQLERVTRIFFGLTNADKTPELGEVEKEVMPLLTDLENDISFNKALFQRIKTVYEAYHPAAPETPEASDASAVPVAPVVPASSAAPLSPEAQKLLEETYKDFVRKGALLDDEKMARMKKINLRISDLQQQWGDALPAATNDAVVWVDSEDELAGLSEADKAQCKADAASRGSQKPYAIVIVNTTQQPLLASLDNRDLRRRVFEASVHRADGTNGVGGDLQSPTKHNTFAIVCEIAKLRAEQAELMGYP